MLHEFVLLYSLAAAGSCGEVKYEGEPAELDRRIPKIRDWLHRTYENAAFLEREMGSLFCQGKGWRAR